MVFSTLKTFLKAFILILLISPQANAQDSSDSFGATLAADVYRQATPTGGDDFTHQQFLEDEVFADYLIYLNTVGLRLAAFELKLQQTKSIEKNQSCSEQDFRNIDEHKNLPLKLIWRPSSKSLATIFVPMHKADTSSFHRTRMVANVKKLRQIAT